MLAVGFSVCRDFLIYLLNTQRIYRKAVSACSVVLRLQWERVTQEKPNAQNHSARHAATGHIEARRPTDRQLGHGIRRLLAQREFESCWPLAFFGFNGS